MPKLIATFHALFTRNEKLSTASIGGLMLLAIAVMGLVSLTSLNDKAIKGYMLNKLENERQELVSDGEITEMLTLRARAMDTIESQVTHMVAPETVSYVMPVSIVAQNQESSFE